jgi:hypothetical protein
MKRWWEGLSFGWQMLIAYTSWALVIVLVLPWLLRFCNWYWSQVLLHG